MGQPNVMQSSVKNLRQPSKPNLTRSAHQIPQISTTPSQPSLLPTFSDSAVLHHFCCSIEEPQRMSVLSNQTWPHMPSLCTRVYLVCTLGRFAKDAHVKAWFGCAFKSVCPPPNSIGLSLCLLNLVIAQSHIEQPISNNNMFHTILRNVVDFQLVIYS